MDLFVLNFFRVQFQSADRFIVVPAAYHHIQIILPITKHVKVQCNQKTTKTKTCAITQCTYKHHCKKNRPTDPIFLSMFPETTIFFCRPKCISISRAPKILPNIRFLRSVIPNYLIQIRISDFSLLSFAPFLSGSLARKSSMLPLGHPVSLMFHFLKSS